MVGWHDKRRELFFDSLGKGIYVDRDAVDQVVYPKSCVRVRAGAPVAHILRELVEFEPRRSQGKILFDRVPRKESPATVALEKFPDDLDPCYIFVSQQRVQPGNDPEHGAPLPRAPQGSRLGKGVKIAVVDTGFANQNGARDVWSGRLPQGDEDPLFDCRIRPPRPQRLAWAAGHATFIGSLIRQVAPAAKIIPIKACSPMGFETEDEVARGINRAVAKGAHIINLSWCSYPFVSNGGAPGAHAPSRLRAAVDNAVKKAVVVAAAGNSASPDEMFPAAWPDVLAVGALDRNGRRWEHSNYGKWVDTWALGEKLRAVYVAGKENPANDPDRHAETWDDPNINYATWTGTSFATPLVAAQIAIIQSAAGCTPHKARDILLAMSQGVPGVGGGKRILVDVPGQT